MPGGLLPIAQQKYKDVVDINTSHAIALEAENYLEGDEWGATLQNSDWTSRQKTDHLKNTLGEMKVRGMASIQNPIVLQKLNLSFDEKLAKAEKKVYEIEKDQQTLQIIQGQRNIIKDAKGFARRTKVALKDTFTANFIKNMAKDTLAIAPWMSEAEAKILTFKNLASDPDVLGEPSVINEIMKEEFSKGFTYTALLAGKGEDSEEFKKVYTQWSTDTKDHFKKIDDDNKALALQKVKNANKAVMAHIEDGGSADSATQIAKQYGITDIAAVNKIQTAATKYENNIKFGFDTPEGMKLLEQIVLNNITDPDAVRIYMLDNGYDLKSFSEYKPFITLETNQRKTALDKYIKTTRTINNHAASMLKKALNFDVVIDLETGKIDREALMASMFDVGIDQKDVLEAMSALQSIRDHFDTQAVVGAKKAAIENTDPDLQTYRSEYEKQIAQVIDNLQQGNPPFGKPQASTKADFVDTGVTPEPVDKPIERYDRTSALVHNLSEFINVETKEATEFLKDPKAITKADKEYIDNISKENPEAFRQAVTQKAIEQLPDPLVKQLDNELDKFSSINTIGFSARELREQLKKIPKKSIIEKDTRNFFQKLDQRFDNVIKFLDDASLFPDKPATKQELSSTAKFLEIFTDIISPSTAEGVELKLGEATGRVTTEGRKEYKNNLGGTSTEYTIGTTNPKINGGKLTHIPSIYNGKPVSQKEAEDIIIANGGKDPETGRFITPGGDPKARSEAIEFKEEPQEKEMRFKDEKIASNTRKSFRLKQNNISDEEFQENFDKIAKVISYLESKNITDAVQKAEGPGRGKFQYEPESLKTALTRHKKITGEDRSETDASKLKAEEQLDILISDHAETPKSSKFLKNIIDSKGSVESLVLYWGAIHKKVFTVDNKQVNIANLSKKEALNIPQIKDKIKEVKDNFTAIKNIDLISSGL